MGIMEKVWDDGVWGILDSDQILLVRVGMSDNITFTYWWS